MTKKKSAQASPKKQQAETEELKARSKFLVFVDESEFSRVAVRFACTRAKNKNRPVVMLFVINPADYNSILAITDVIKRDRRSEVEELLKSLAEEAHIWSGVMPSVLIREGDAEGEIIKAVEEDHDINMLIISSSPSQGSGGRKLLGSLAEELDHRLHVPMVIVPSHLTLQQIKELS